MLDTTERRIRMLIYLCKNRSARIADLANEFHVSHPTIRNDLQKMVEVFPYYTEVGRNGGIRVMEQFVIGTQYFSQKQVEVLEKNLHKFEGEDLEIVKTILRDFSAPKKK